MWKKEVNHGEMKVMFGCTEVDRIEEKGKWTELVRSTIVFYQS